MASIEPITKGRGVARIVPAQAIVAAFENHVTVHPETAGYLPRALEEAPHFAGLREIAEAQQELDNALLEPQLPNAVMEAACARLLDQLNVKAEDRLAVIDGLIQAVDEASDPLARQLELYPTTDRPIAPVVFALGLRTVHATSKFSLKPADLREAIVKVHWRLRKMLKALNRAFEHREAINDTILLHAPRYQAMKVLGYNELTTAMHRRFAQERAGLPLDLEEEEQPRRVAACRVRSDVKTKAATTT